MSGFPPSGPTSVQKIIPSYLYEQYFDDEDLQALVSAFNQMAQARLDWFNTTNLPIYTGLNGPLLDIVAEGLYGMRRPSIPTGNIVTVGPLNTWMLNTPNITLNTFFSTGAVSLFETTDDIFKRIITWNFFKGDGQIFTFEWMKRRIMRFLIGFNGISSNIDQTYPIGLAEGVDNVHIITITLTPAAGITLSNAQVFQAIIASRVVALPFQLKFSVTIVNNLVATGLVDTADALHVTILTGWPTSSTGLPPGSVWSNAGVVTVVPGITPNPFAPPLVFGVVTSSYLLLIGGGDLPLSNPGVGSGILWNNAGIVNVA